MSGDRYVHESEVLTYLAEDGRVLDRLVAGAQPRIGPNKFDACRYLVAYLSRDGQEQYDILRHSPAVPLFAGMATLALGFAQALFGENVLDRLQALGADLDDSDLEGPARQFHTLGEENPP